jgi:hypothetical protein
MEETSETTGIGSGVTGKPGVSYDTEKLGEPGQPGVPTGDQYPTNERENITEHGDSPGIDVPQDE